MAYNCPNCGAPITDSVCEYCGTRHQSIEVNLLELKHYQLDRDIANIQTQIRNAEQTNCLLSMMQTYRAFGPNDICGGLRYDRTN